MTRSLFGSRPVQAPINLAPPEFALASRTVSNAVRRFDAVPSWKRLPKVKSAAHGDLQQAVELLTTLSGRQVNQACREQIVRATSAAADARQAISNVYTTETSTKYGSTYGVGDAVTALNGLQRHVDLAAASFDLDAFLDEQTEISSRVSMPRPEALPGPARTSFAEV